MVAFMLVRSFAFPMHFLRPISRCNESRAPNRFPSLSSLRSTYPAIPTFSLLPSLSGARRAAHTLSSSSFTRSGGARARAATFFSLSDVLGARYAIPKIYGCFRNIFGRSHAWNHLTGGRDLEILPSHPKSPMRDADTGIRRRWLFAFRTRQVYLIQLGGSRAIKCMLDFTLL